jgi:Zn-dependent protease/CBS domain-containing protein
MSETKSVPSVRKKMTGFRLGSVLGFEIRIDLSWFLIFFLVFWSLSVGVFPQRFPELPRATQLAMGLVGTLLFFGSLLTHELSHALVSRSKGIPIEGITLFIFGGMAMTRREPDSPKDELLIAGVGPLTSLALAGLFAVAGWAAAAAGLGPQVWGVTGYLAFINLVLAIFNLAPGFPLDGGRVFRAITWWVTGDRSKATRWAVEGGRWLGLVLMVLGGVEALTGAALSGLWLVFIGWFLRNLAGTSLRQQVIQEVLSGHIVSDLMTPQPDVVNARLPLAALVNDHFMRLRYGSYPVVEGGQLVGMVTLENVKRVPADAWAGTMVSEAMTPLAECIVVAPGTSVEDALQEMSSRGVHARALVVDKGRLVGIVSASDIARWMQRLQAMESLVGRKQ